MAKKIAFLGQGEKVFFWELLWGFAAEGRGDVGTGISFKANKQTKKSLREAKRDLSTEINYFITQLIGTFQIKVGHCNLINVFF